VPFKKVYLHGMVRDKKGIKMSKSKGNVIAPQEIQDRFGTDALRMGLIVNNAPGSDMNLDPDKVNAYKKFANKLWNITRFTLDNLDGVDMEVTLTELDAANLENELHQTVADITGQMNKDRFDLAAEKLYAFVWDYFASTLIEESKELLTSHVAAVRASRQRLLAEYLVASLKMLHPFMPFVTEAIWQELPKELKDQDMVMVAKWPGA
jgi:valyl-tRNA synthetase